MADDAAAIIQVVLGGNSEAFAELIRRYQARLRLACSIRLGNSSEGDDAAQAVFVKAFQNLKHFKGESSFETWLHRIAENHCLDLLRSRQRHKTESLDALLDEKHDALEAFLTRSELSPKTSYSPDELALLSHLLGALPKEARDILLLREVEELSYDEIALRLNCSLDAVKGRLKRARQALVEKSDVFFVAEP